MIEFAPSADPQPASAVIGDRPGVAGAQAAPRRGDWDEAVKPPIIESEAACGVGRPEAPPRISVHGLDPATRRRGGVETICAEAIAVPAGDPPLGARPDETVAILGEGRDQGVGQSLILAIGLKDGVGECGPSGLRRPGGRRRNVEGDDESRAWKRSQTARAG
jgi:hypothetical protein